jgi:hypothetical protein
MANDSDSIGGSVLRETVERDNRKYGHHHKNGFAHQTVLPSPAKNVPDHATPQHPERNNDPAHYGSDAQSSS